MKGELMIYDKPNLSTFLTHDWSKPITLILH